MKTINKLKVVSAAMAIGFIVATTQAQQVISWNFDGYGDISGPSQQTGAVLAPYWNSTYLIDGNSGVPENNLLDNTGTPTTLGASFVSNSQYGQAAATRHPERPRAVVPPPRVRLTLVDWAPPRPSQRRRRARTRRIAGGKSP